MSTKEKKLKDRIAELNDENADLSQRLIQAGETHDAGLLAYELLDDKYSTLATYSDELEDDLHTAEQALLDQISIARSVPYWRRLWLAIRGKSP